MNVEKSILTLLLLAAAINEVLCQAPPESTFVNTITNNGDTLPRGYAPPLVSNGSLCMLVDFQGGQTQKEYVKMKPTIWWQGRRYNVPPGDLVPFGHFEEELVVNGKICKKPVSWSQTLDTKNAVVTCKNEYENQLTVETVVFTHLLHNLIVIKKRYQTKNAVPVSATFRYRFTPPGTENKAPHRITSQCQWKPKTRSADFKYDLDGFKPIKGIISVFADRDLTPVIDNQVVSFTTQISPGKNRTEEVTYYLLFTDSMDGKDYQTRSESLRTFAKEAKYEGVLDSHRKQWAAYWDESFVRLSDPLLEQVYNTAQYHLRCVTTQWSFPVGIFPTHWRGLYFGWDEMFCFQAMASSNHLSLSKRCPEYRFSILPHAKKRISHYNNPGTYGARYLWMESEEGGKESAGLGFWMDHVFHMSNITLSCWLQYLYSGDTEYLKSTGYPVIKECARFYATHMVYENPDGSMFIGKCTDLERLGPAILNPFMTACGAIYTLEAAAGAAGILNEDKEEAARWSHVALKLRESLPSEGDKYVPFAGGKERSIASMGGLFPYPVFDASNTLQKNAVYDFVREGRASGNMYPVGNSVCPWYAGWMASALTLLNDKTEPVKLLTETAATAGYFADLFEINEPEVSMHPWFSTASGNYVYAINQMLVQSRGDQIIIAPSVPLNWKEYSFKLACYGNLVITVSVNKGAITKLVLSPGNPDAEMERTFLIPEHLLDNKLIKKEYLPFIKKAANGYQIDLKFKGEISVMKMAS